MKIVHRVSLELAYLGWTCWTCGHPTERQEGLCCCQRYRVEAENGGDLRWCCRYMGLVAASQGSSCQPEWVHIRPEIHAGGRTCWEYKEEDWPKIPSIWKSQWSTCWTVLSDRGVFERDFLVSSGWAIRTLRGENITLKGRIPNCDSRLKMPLPSYHQHVTVKITKVNGSATDSKENCWSAPKH